MCWLPAWERRKKNTSLSQSVSVVMLLSRRRNHQHMESKEGCETSFSSSSISVTKENQSEELRIRSGCHRRRSSSVWWVQKRMPAFRLRRVEMREECVKMTLRCQLCDPKRIKRMCDVRNVCWILSSSSFFFCLFTPQPWESADGPFSGCDCNLYDALLCINLLNKKCCC